MFLLLSVLAASASALDLYAICPGYPHGCDNNLIAFYMRQEAEQLNPGSTAAPCPNFPLCDVNHVAIAQWAAAGIVKRSVVPGAVPGLIEGTPAAAQWWAARQAVEVAQARTGAVVPGAVPGLVPGSAAAAQWWAAQEAQRALLGRKKRSVVPGTIPGLIEGSPAAAQWWAAQQAQQVAVARNGVVVPGAVPGLIAGSAAADQWWKAQQAQRALLA